MSIKNVQLKSLKPAAVMLVVSWVVIFLGSLLKMMSNNPSIANSFMLVGVLASTVAILWIVYSILRS